MTLKVLTLFCTLYLLPDLIKSQCDPSNILTCPTSCCQDANTCSQTFNFTSTTGVGCFSVNCALVSCGSGYCCTNNACQAGNCTDTSSSGGGDSKKGIFRIVGIVVLVLVILCIIGCVVYCIRRRMKRKKMMENEESNKNRPKGNLKYQQPEGQNTSSLGA